MNKILYIFCFSISVVFLDISMGVVLICHPASQKNVILFPSRVNSGLFCSSKHSDSHLHRPVDVIVFPPQKHIKHIHLAASACLVLQTILLST